MKAWIVKNWDNEEVLVIAASSPTLAASIALGIWNADLSPETHFTEDEIESINEDEIESINLVGEIANWPSVGGA